MSSNFIDYVKIYTRSGSGGAGSVHFRREKFVPKGGPDGGDGGRGGDIIIRGNSQIWTLLHLKYRKHVFASDGKSGERAHRKGADGKDVILEVPLGTIARNADSNEILAEIIKDKEEIVITPGGKGGLGNDHFKSATNQSPRVAQPGEPGIERSVVLELKLLADVGLVGLPNAGKSTLLSVVSAAKPRIADYPFTTLIPNLGVVPYHEYKSFVMADIPGIIEGAAEGRGLGYRFLRHIERNAVLLFMIPADSIDIKKEFNILVNELQKYNPELLDKKRMLVITKSDLLDEELMKEMKLELPENTDTEFISSLTYFGIDNLKNKLWDLLTN